MIYRRFDDNLMTTGLTEVREAYREGRINVAPPPGVGIADDKGVFPHVPRMIEHYLGEAPILRNAPTFSLLDPGDRAEALERLPELVLKPREGYGGKGILIGSEADDPCRNRSLA